MPIVKPTRIPVHRPIMYFPNSASLVNVHRKLSGLIVLGGPFSYQSNRVQTDKANHKFRCVEIKETQFTCIGTVLFYLKEYR